MSKAQLLIFVLGVILLLSLGALTFFAVPSQLPPSLNSLPTAPAGLTIAVPWPTNYLRGAMLTLILAALLLWGLQAYLTFGSLRWRADQPDGAERAQHSDVQDRA